MTPVIHKTEEARQDLADHFVFIGRNSPAAADRFVDAAEKAFERLAHMPEMGSLWETENPEVAGLRFWPIRSFEKYLVFYKAISDGIEIIRVVHGSQDLESLFGPS